jgi:hypothetical protein
VGLSFEDLFKSPHPPLDPRWPTRADIERWRLQKLARLRSGDVQGAQNVEADYRRVLQALRALEAQALDTRVRLLERAYALLTESPKRRGAPLKVTKAQFDAVRHLTKAQQKARLGVKSMRTVENARKKWGRRPATPPQ